MGLAHSPRIVTDNLVLGLDAANTKSYGGSGTTWSDLSGKGNNGTVTGSLHSQGPFPGGSGYVTFDGTDDYFTTTYSTSEFRWWDTDYTIEAWIYPTTLTDWYSSTVPSLVGNMDPSGITDYWSFGPYNSSGNVKFYYWNGSSQNDMVSTESVTANSWNHIAFIKNSSGCKIFVNGVGTDYMSISGTPQDSTSYDLTVGAYNNADINGYVSDLRIVRGTALYTSNFTVPKKSLQNTSNTKLLTCQGSSITDASDSSHNISVNGNSASVYDDDSYFEFDGSNDYVSHSNDSFVSNGGATLECWFNIDTLSADRTLINHSGFTYFNLLRTSNNKIRLEYKSTSQNNTQLFSTSTISTGSWYHVVGVVNNTGARIYINGELDASNSTSQNLGTVSSTLYVGGYHSGNDYRFDGKIAVAKRYNKPLTATEVAQNFNALRGRYGI
jgi:hypothetical protein